MKQKITIERDGKIEKVIECDQFLLVDEQEIDIGRIYDATVGLSEDPFETLKFYLALLDILKRIEEENVLLGFLRRDYQNGTFDEIIKKHHLKVTGEES